MEHTMCEFGTRLVYLGQKCILAWGLEHGAWGMGLGVWEMAQSIKSRTQ